MRKKIRKIVYPILLLFTLYIIAGLILTRRQDQIIFKPDTLDSSYTFQSDWPHKVFDLDVSRSIKLKVYYLHTDSARGQVLYFPGNSGNISTHLSRMSFFLKKGYNVFIPDYPGYGKSTGYPSERSFNNTGKIVYELASNYMQPDSTIIYGKGMGSAVASYISSHEKCKALVLVSPFYSLSEIASHYFPVYPVKKYLKYRFPVYRYVQHTLAPVYLFHGEKDNDIPFSESVQLSKKLFEKDRFIPLPDANHKNVMQQPLFMKTMDSIMTQ